MNDWEVVVGNIGMVYAGPDEGEAMTVFKAFVKLSELNYGRGAGEPVALLRNGVIEREHVGRQREEDEQ